MSAMVGWDVCYGWMECLLWLIKCLLWLDGMSAMVDQMSAMVGWNVCYG